LESRAALVIEALPRAPICCPVIILSEYICKYSTDTGGISQSSADFAVSHPSVTYDRGFNFNSSFLIRQPTMYLSRALLTVFLLTQTAQADRVLSKNKLGQKVEELSEKVEELTQKGEELSWRVDQVEKESGETQHPAARVPVSDIACLRHILIVQSPSVSVWSDSRYSFWRKSLRVVRREVMHQMKASVVLLLLLALNQLLSYSGVQGFTWNDNVGADLRTCVGEQFTFEWNYTLDNTDMEISKKWNAVVSR
ncbi:hypothetical protein BaRGS_00034691, partial [Batillaria attramentaria]